MGEMGQQPSRTLHRNTQGNPQRGLCHTGRTSEEVEVYSGFDSSRQSEQTKSGLIRDRSHVALTDFSASRDECMSQTEISSDLIKLALLRLIKNKGQGEYKGNLLHAQLSVCFAR